MMQINVSLTILLSYFPEDFNLDSDNLSKTKFRKLVNENIEKIVKEIKESTDLEVNDIEIDVCGE